MEKRFLNLSLFRIIATLLIIQFHIFYIIYPYHVSESYLYSKFLQGFMVLSGFLYSQRNITNAKEFYIKNLKKILIPALSCLIFMIIWDVGYMFITSTYDFFALFTGRTAFSNAFLIQPGNYYYLAYLLGCYLVTPLLKRNRKIGKCIVGLVITIEILLSFFVSGVSIVASCYFIGFYIGEKRFDEYVNPDKPFKMDRLLIWIFVAFLAGSFTTLLYPYYHTGIEYIDHHLGLLNHNLYSTIYGVAIFFAIIYSLKPINRFNHYPILKFTDSSLIYVYLMNQAFMIGAMDITKYTDNMLLKTLLVYVVTIFVGLSIFSFNKYVFKKK